jgi:hypothetical protein
MQIAFLIEFSYLIYNWLASFSRLAHRESSTALRKLIFYAQHYMTKALKHLYMLFLLRFF